MQAVTGLERAVGGEGNDPLAPTWIPIDMSGGWVTALGILAGLFARANDGHGHQVATSLLGAGMLMQSGVFERDGALVPGPQLDGAQTGYGPGYRIYQCSDGEWLAVVLPDLESWERVRALVAPAAFPSSYAPLRGGSHDDAARNAEVVLERLFGSEPRDAWVVLLGALEIPVEAIGATSRDQFRRGILDDPVNRQLGRVASFDTADWGFFEQIGPLLRYGPEGGDGPPLLLPGIGEHTTEVLEELRFSEDEIAALLAAKAVRQQ
jgi:crotonobetainyl-CoA:carnitine CoA-transferase CaiB-like acyl-CoA transferase